MKLVKLNFRFLLARTQDETDVMAYEMLYGLGEGSGSGGGHSDGDGSGCGNGNGGGWPGSGVVFGEGHWAGYGSGDGIGQGGGHADGTGKYETR